MTAQQLANKITSMFRGVGDAYYNDSNIASLVALKLGTVISNEITSNLQAVCSYSTQFSSGVARIPIQCTASPVRGTDFSSWSASLKSLLSSITVNGTGEGLTITGLRPVVEIAPITQDVVHEKQFESSWLAVSEYILNSISGPFVVNWPATFGSISATVNSVTIL